MMRTQRQTHQPVPIFEDDNVSDENETVLDESRDPLAESSGCMNSGSDEEDEVEDSVAEDMKAFEEAFSDLGRQYRLINRIGEGNWRYTIGRTIR